MKKVIITNDGNRLSGHGLYDLGSAKNPAQKQLTGRIKYDIKNLASLEVSRGSSLTNWAVNQDVNSAESAAEKIELDSSPK
jgi:hypothetical protein